MAFFDERPQLFRILYALLAVFVIAVSATSLYRLASTATDESHFWTSPGNIYITRSMPGESIATNDRQIPDELRQAPGDSILTGDLFLFLNNERFLDPRDIEQFVAEQDPDTELEFVIFRPKALQEFAFLVKAGDLPDSSFRTIPSTVYVAEIMKDGAAARAGMQVGDLISAINNASFKDAFEATRVLRSAQSNRSITYEIIRDNQPLNLQITLASVGIQISVLLLVLCGFICMGTGIFVAMQRPQFRAARLLGVTFLALGYFVSISFHRDISLDFFAQIRLTLMTVTVFTIFPLWLHLLHYFPIERSGLLEQRWLRYGSYAVAIICIVLTPILGPHFVLWGMFTLLIYNVVLPQFLRKYTSSEYYKLSRIIDLTILSVALVIGVFFLIAYLSGPPEQAAAPRGPGGIAAGFVAIMLTLIPLSYLYTIGHYRLLELDLRVRRSIQYTVLSTAWGMAILAILLGLLITLPMINFNLPNVRFTGTYLEIVGEPMEPEHRQLMERLLLMFLAIGVSSLFWRIRRSGQRFIDRAYNRSQYDYRRAAGILAEVMATHLTMVGLAEGIVEKLAQLMQVKQVGIIFFRNEVETCCQEAHGVNEEEWQRFSTAASPKIIALIQGNRSDYRFSAEYLPGDMRDEFMQQGFRHIISIRSKEKLVGVLLIGEKRSEAPFHKDDLVFLAAVAKQASVAIENAFLYEELAGQERLKLELDIARRIQIASLPQTTPQIDGLDIAGISIPAQEVGGDYFDYLKNGISNEITVIVGDVSGKGTSAALYMSKAQGIMRSLFDFGLSPRELLIRANNLLTGDIEKKSFITAVGASFNSGKNLMLFARAGHLPLYWYQASKKSVEMISPRGIGLGLTRTNIFADELEEKELSYQSGDIFVFITDGITEAHDRSGEMFGDEALLEIMRENNAASAKRIRDHIITAVNRFAGDVIPHDDVTVVVVKAT